MAAGDITVTDNSTVTFNGVIAAPTSNFTLTGAANIVAGTGGQIGATTLTLGSANGIGTAANPLGTQATTIVANAGAGGVYLAEADGASVTATATGAGNVSITNATGTLNIAGATTTVTGNLSLSSGGAITLGANLNAGSGTITIAADTLGTTTAGTAAFDQMGASITTTNTTANALSITVNTASAGAGDAIIGKGSVGSNSGGTVTVNSNGGNILWSNDPSYTAFGNSQLGTANGGSNTQVLKTNNYVFTTATTGSGSIGTAARPLQTDSYAAADSTADAANLYLTAGSGGIYVVDWGANGNNDITLRQASAQGAGNILVVAANAGGHDLFVDGPVSTGSGSIALYADDDLIFTNNAQIGGTGFSGTVDLRQDRDNANGEFFYMAPGSSIVTSNASSGMATPAVQILGYSAAGSSDTVVLTDVAGGGLELGNITVGAGGTILANANANTNAGGQGSIVQQPGTLLSTGSTGSLILIAKAVDASGSGNTSAGYGLGNIGIGGTQAAPLALPIITDAGTISATTVGTSLANTGNINIIATGAASFSASTTGNATGTINLTTNAGVLTVGGPTNTDGGAITLTSTSTTGGVAITGVLDDSDTGPITINAGTNPATLSNTLTLNDNQALTVTATGGLTVAATGVLAGTGATTNTYAVATQPGGTVSPGAIPTTVGTLNTGNMNLTGGTFAVDLTASGSNLLNVTGTVTLTGATLSGTLDTGFTPTVGTVFTIINNDGTDAVIGTFAGLPEGSVTTIGGLPFQVSYVGGDGNDVTLTAVNPPATLIVTNFTPTPTGFTVQFSAPVNAAVVNLYDQDGAYGAADVTLVGATTGAVTGSLVFNSDNSGFTFVSAAGLLPADNYTLTLVSGTSAFNAAAGGGLLDGNNDGTPGDNYTNVFTVASLPSNAVVLSVPSFTRGYGQPVNVPASGSGIPLTLSTGVNVTSVTFTLNFNPALLQLDSFTVNPTLIAEGASGTMNVNNNTGVANFIVSSASPFSTAAGALTLGTISATVPNTATYTSKEVLHISNLVIDDNEAIPQPLPSYGQDGVHVAAFFGDTNGSQGYSSADEVLLQRAVVGSNSGFSAYKDAAPVVTAGLAGNATLGGADATLLQRVILNNSTTTVVPPLPTGITPPATGPDPEVFIPQNLTVTAGQTVTVPVNLMVTESSNLNGISGFDVAILYDPTAFSVAATGAVTLGSLVSGSNLTGVTFTLAYNAANPGHLDITAYTSDGTTPTSLSPGTVGSLVNIQFTALTTAALGSSAINLVPQDGNTPTDVNDNNAIQYTLSPAPTSASNDSVDGVVTITMSTSIMTTTTITDQGPNPSLNFGSTVQPVSFLVHVAPASGSVAGDTVSLSDNGVAISGATGTLDASGNATITLSTAAQLAVGSHPITATFATQGNFTTSTSLSVTQNVVSSLQVDSATLAGNYVQLVFDGPVDPNTTQLFYSPGATAVAPNITLTGPGGSVKGSLLIDATHPNVATFVATAGELAPGNYTVAVTNSVKAVGGATLASNYSQPLTVASPLVTPVVTAAFVARGPGQTVNIPNSSTGLPITLSGITSAVQSLSFTLTYDPTLLSVTAATLSTDAASNGNLVLNPISFTSIDAHHMLITFTIVGGSGGGHWNPSGGTGTLLTLTATVPQNAPYTDKALLATQSVVLNGTAAQGDDAIDVNAYQGDIDGSHTYTGLDASLIDRVSVGQGTGFSVFKDLDPWIIGSVTASGTLGVTGLDAADVDKAAVGSFPSVIPQPPTGFTITGPLGPDPRLYLAAATGGDGQTVTVQERFNVSGADPSTEIDAIDSVIEYDPSKFTVSNIRAGSLLPGFSVTTNVDAVHGVIRVSEFTANPAQAPNPTDGDVLLLDFTVNSSAPLGPSPLKLAASYTDANNTSTTTAVYNATSALTLGPAPQNPSTLPLSGSTVSPFVTNVDNYFSVVGHSGTEGFPANTTATAGGTVTIPINFSNGPVPFDIAAVDNAIKFNPLLLQVTNVTVGSLLMGFSLTTNVDNTNGVLRTSEFTANEAAVSGGQVGAVLQITFAVNGSASGSIPLYILQSYTDSNNTTTTTAVYDDNGAITLTPAPQGTGSNPVFVTGVDGNLNIVVQPNQPPYASLPVPAVIPEALFNPAAHAGLQTVTPNTVAFSAATGDAIIVTDSDYTASGSPETTTLTLTGSPAGTSSGPVGTLTAAASGQAMVSGGGTQPLVITGSPSDITATLSSLVYTPGPGFFGTATLTVSTTDNGNSGYGGSLTDVRSTSITVVGLFLSEIDTLKGNTTNPSQYIEIFSTVPSYTIPPGVYLTGINGVSGSTPAAGVLADIFNLSGFTTGSNGYLALLQKNEKYSSGGFEVAGGNQLDNSGTGVGFGSGNTSKFGTVTGVHTGSTRPTGQLATDILLTGAESFLLIQTPTAPTTTTNIDPANTGNPSNQTSAYNGWNVLDSVGILDSASTSHAYAAITFKPTGATGTTLAGSNVVNTGTWVANYVGRIAQNTGSSGADWLGSVVTGTPSSGMFFLGSPNSTAFAGQPLNSIGGPNDWAPQLTVAVNDDSSNQHSQVAELTLTFSTPVNIVDLASDFVLKDASGNPLSINVSDPVSGATTEGASGPVPDSGATQLFVTFNADATHTFNFITPYLDQFGNTLTVGLVDGNYFLNTKVADISAASNSAVLLDGAKNGMSGSTTSGTGNLNGNGVNQVDEFWRLFGDTEGRRQVDGVDTTNFRTVNGVTQETSGMTAGITAASESNNTVTITTSAPSGFLMGEIVNIVGLPAGYNGSFVILSVNGNTFTYMAPTSGLTAVTNPTGAAATLNSYQWYLDYNEDGNIDVGNTLEQTQLINRLFTQLPA